MYASRNHIAIKSNFSSYYIQNNRVLMGQIANALQMKPDEIKKDQSIYENMIPSVSFEFFPKFFNKRLISCV